MSLLRANGHPDAGSYPIGMVHDEAKLLVETKNQQFATLGVVIQAATATTGMGASKDALSHFKKLIKGLAGEE